MQSTVSFDPRFGYVTITGLIGPAEDRSIGDIHVEVAGDRLVHGEVGALREIGREEVRGWSYMDGPAVLLKGDHGARTFLVREADYAEALRLGGAA